MAQRHKDLLNAAVRLFQQHGFHATSIEDITRSCGISKGAFYKHFDSKEAMILELLQRYYDEIFTEADRYAEALTHAPLLKLKKKITIELEKSMEYQSFLYALMTEFPPHEKGAIPELLNRIYHDHHKWHVNAILEAFGSDAKKYTKDLTIMMEGIIHSYMMAIIWRGADLSPEKLGAFVVDCLYVIVANREQLLPVMPVYSNSKHHQETMLADMKHELDTLCLELNNKTEKTIAETKDIQALEMLIDELEQGYPREFLIDALLQQLYRRPNLKNRLRKTLTAWEMWKGD
ncbi:TetR/AcrR family transcriptional regulator [Lentibacillus cibarius]|uniref:TetR/AcrR family transcriptional regulator n=1 Tax=Lentibacillus cibarius TaxID=2583219 RepID=A0A5S3QNZ3_9BACI|nr:TetR/AcrR family transcriptional regulator [Lentibacillus cibarius]TMN23378.1 TetR/AcrR family transcriptional regulator [Lentibacillus cibarius]